MLPLKGTCVFSNTDCIETAGFLDEIEENKDYVDYRR
jgi:hypothetical protein